MTVLASFDMNELLQIWLLESDGHRVISVDEFIAISLGGRICSVGLSVDMEERRFNTPFFTAGVL